MGAGLHGWGTPRANIYMPNAMRWLRKPIKPLQAGWWLMKPRCRALLALLVAGAALLLLRPAAAQQADWQALMDLVSSVNVNVTLPSWTNGSDPCAGTSALLSACTTCRRGVLGEVPPGACTRPGPAGPQLQGSKLMTARSQDSPKSG